MTQLLVDVTQLLVDVGTAKHEIDVIKATADSNDPWFQRRAPTSTGPHNAPDNETSDGPDGAGHAREAAGPARGSGGRRALPLRLTGPLGSIGYKDRPIFDEKMSTLEEYKFNGVKNGIAWKTKTERHFIARAPVLRDILEFAELEDMTEVTTERFRLAVGAFLSEDQVMAVNAAIWGFLAGCVSGAAEAIFDTADQLNGLDAWRRLVRHIDHGREINLEMLRREMKHIQNRTIKDIFGIEEGIANFDNAIGRYTKAGGDPMRDSEKKSDLLAILPDAIRKDLLWHAADGGPYETFRNMILAQTQKIILNTRRGINGVNAVDNAADAADDILNKLNQGVGDKEELLDDLCAALDARRGRGGRPGKPTPRAKSEPRGAADGARPPRRCPNCGETHKELKCPKPPVEFSQRPCWNCKKTGHNSRDCPKAKTVAAVGPDEQLIIASVEQEGFAAVRRGARPRPTPRPATLGDYILGNAFAPLAEEATTTTTTTARSPGPASSNHKSSSARERLELSRTTTSPTSEHSLSKPSWPLSAKTQAKRLRFQETQQSAKSKESNKNEASKGPGERRAVSSQQPAASSQQPAASSQQPATSDAQTTPKPATTVDEFKELLKLELDNVKAILAAEVSCLTHADDDDDDYDDYDDNAGALMQVSAEATKIAVVLDSGSVTSVIHPKDLPKTVTIVPNVNGRHFKGAGTAGHHIENYGTAKTSLRASPDSPDIACEWSAADVHRPLHAVVKVTGTVEQPKADVLFCAGKAVVVPAGTVDRVLKTVKPLLQYDRKGDLFIAELTVSAGFPGPGAAR